MLALAKHGNLRRKEEMDTRGISIPVILPESSTLSSDYITQCVKEGNFVTSYPAAKVIFGKQNIIQIHRDLNEHCSSTYRRIMAEKLGRPDCLQIEFYIPDPRKKEAALLHFYELAIQEEMYATSLTDACRKFDEETFEKTVWNQSELVGKKKELASAMRISAPSVMFFTPFPYVYGEIK